MAITQRELSKNAARGPNYAHDKHAHDNLPILAGANQKSDRVLRRRLHEEVLGKARRKCDAMQPRIQRMHTARLRPRVLGSRHTARMV
jgi:hypothetical protein